MAVPAPRLDDRHFQDLVDEAKRRVAQHCPEWTDHNVSDPGVTLIETFAFMVDQLLYRLNRVPDRHYRKFLELIGLRMYPPVAARVPVTFWLSAAQDRPVVVPGETQVSTVRTEGREAVVFTVEDELVIPSCHLVAARTSTGARSMVDHTDELRTAGSSIACFADPPAPGDAVYFGLSDAVPGAAVLLRIGCLTRGTGIDPRDPPLMWQAFDGHEWWRCTVEKDTTGGFNRSGDVVVHVPPQHTPGTVGGTRAGWLRCVVVPARPDQPAYADPPTLDTATASVIGGTTDAVHADFVHDEVLGTSTGLPGQRFRLQRGPLVDTAEPMVVEVCQGGESATWTEVDTFAHCAEQARHVRVDRVAGEVAFGPAVREEDGGTRHHGAVPPIRSRLRVPVYRVGGGEVGNVVAGAVQVLRDPVPFVSAVCNLRAAQGGQDGETVENAIERGPFLLRTRDRAVTLGDYRRLAADAICDGARIFTLPAGRVEEGPAGDRGDRGDDATTVADAVRVLVVPRVDPGDLSMAQLQPPREMLERITSYLDERRCLGARVVVEPPYYQGVTVIASLQARVGVDPERVKEQAVATLDRYVNPLSGGPRGTGWRLGRAVSQGDVHAVLERVSGVAWVDEVRLYPADPRNGRRGAVTQRITLPPNGLAISFQHQVRVADAARDS